MLMKMRRFILDKLIRDNIVEMFEERGTTVHYDILEDDGDFVEALATKIAEELQEMLSAENREDLASELADIDDVLTEFKEVMQIKQSELDKLRKEKRALKGGFEKHIYAKYIDVPPSDKHTLDYVKKNADRFPEIDIEDEE